MKTALAPATLRLREHERLSAPDKADADMAAIQRLAEDFI